MSQGNRNRLPALAVILVGLVIFIVYSNTLHAPWQLDDPPNITDNLPLHIKDLMPATLWRTMFARPFATGHLYRPVPCLSFALNWYIGNNNPFGYHLVNIGLHILTALFILMTGLLLFQTPVMKKYSREDAFFISLLGTLLWALNPVQTQAVTYIVQRMAVLAALFSVLAIYWYLRARLMDKGKPRPFYLFLALLCYLAAVGSKENAAILPMSVLLIEFTFFTSPPDRFGKNIRLVVIGLTALILILSIHKAIRILPHFFSTTGSRPFSPYERLLTEARIMVFYLSILFYPLPQRLSIDHEVHIAHSLFTPWTTPAAIIMLCVLTVIALKLLRNHPLAGFAILFFLINHLVESTIIPLELIFEHRNYLPSMFLFMPVAAGLLHILKSAPRPGLLHATATACVPLLLISLGHGTYLRNQAWRSQDALWRDALTKSPHNARPYAKLGTLAGWAPEKSRKNLIRALGYYEKALKAYSPRTSFKAAILGNMGGVLFRYGFNDNAIVYYRKSLALNPRFSNSRYGLAKALVLEGRVPEALDEVDRGLVHEPGSPRFLNLRGLILLWLKRSQEAVLTFGQAMHASRDKKKYFYNLGVALSKAGHYAQAEWFLRLSQGPTQDLTILFSLIENAIRAGDDIRTVAYTKDLIQHFSIRQIRDHLEKMQHEYHNVPIAIPLIRPVILQSLREAALSP